MAPEPGAIDGDPGADPGRGSLVSGVPLSDLVAELSRLAAGVEDSRVATGALADRLERIERQLHELDRAPRPPGTSVHAAGGRRHREPDSGGRGVTAGPGRRPTWVRVATAPQKLTPQPVAGGRCPRRYCSVPRAQTSVRWPRTAVVGTLLGVALVVSACSTFSNSALGSRNVSVFDLRPGDCVSPPTQIKASISTVEVLPCHVAHTQQVYALAHDNAGADANYPGTPALRTFAHASCLQEFAGYVGIDYRDSSLFYTYLLPRCGAGPPTTAPWSVS